MDRLTPAQQAVLERMQKKKELDAKKLLKKKGKKSGAPAAADAAVEPDGAPSQQGQGDYNAAGVDSEPKKSARAGRGRRTDVHVVSDDTEGSNDDQRKTAEHASDTGDSVPKTPRSARSRKTDVLPGGNETAEESSVSGEADKVTKGGRSRKTISVVEKPVAQQPAMTPAQLEVLEKMKKKRSDNPKGRKSVKSSNVVETKTDTEVEIDSDASLSVTIVEPVAKSRRKTSHADVSLQEHPMTSTMIEAPARGRRKTLNADVSAVAPINTVKEPEKTSNKRKAPKIIDLDESDGDPEPDKPMNVTQLAVMELIRKKKEATVAKSSNSRKSLPANTSRVIDIPDEPAQPEMSRGADDSPKKAAKPRRQSMTPNQIAVMKKIQDKHDQNAKPVSSEDTGDSDASSDDTARPANSTVIRVNEDEGFQQAKELLDILEKGVRRASYRLSLRKLVSAGVKEAVQKLKPLSPVQTNLVATCRQEIMGDEESFQSSGSADVERKSAKKRRAEEDQPSAGPKRKIGDSSKRKPVSANSFEPDDEADTDATEDIVTQEKPPKKAPKAKSPKSPELTSDDDDEMECDTFAAEKEDTKRTFIIFDTNAYLHIYPYCKAVLECDKAKEDEDFESITMFAIFIVVRELDALSKKNAMLRQTAVNAIRLIHGALQDHSPRIEGQDFSSSRERLDGSTVNDDYILKSAELVSKRGDKVIVVTDDTNLQVKVALMRLQALSLIDFIARFHWLSPIVAGNLATDMKMIGEDAIALFAETVMTSIVLKAAMAQLSPMPMEERRTLFPSKKIAPTLAYILKYKRLLEERGEPFASLNYDRVCTTLNALQKYREIDSKNPDRMKHYARFLSSAAILSRSIAAFFPNMQTRADLMAAFSNAYQHHLPANDRVQHQPPETMTRRPRMERQHMVTSAAPLPLAESYPQRVVQSGRKTLLPTPPTMCPNPSSESAVSGAAVMHHSANSNTDPAAVESHTRSSRPATAVTPMSRQLRQGQGGRGQEPTARSEPVEPVYFSFSEGQKTAEPLRPPAPPANPALASPARYLFAAPSPPARQRQAPPPASAGPTGPLPSVRNAGGGHQANPYAACQELISTDVFQTVYDYFQQFGTSVCNYTGSCCVKMGVRFTLAFTASGAHLEPSLHEVTETFGQVLQSMKRLLTDAGSTVDNAKLFLEHSGQVMKLLGRADANLATTLPDISPNGLLQFVTDAGGKSTLAAGYNQFCDFNNCLEKCWLDLQQR